MALQEPISALLDLGGGSFGARHVACGAIGLVHRDRTPKGDGDDDFSHS